MQYLFKSILISSILTGISLTVFASPSTQLDIKPDCSEKPISIEHIKSISKRSNVHTVEDFLEALPSDVMQTFTFVPSTKSLQHHRVNEEWPRVLRMNANGSIAMGFVCNPDSQDYGKVEVLFIDGNFDQAIDKQTEQVSRISSLKTEWKSLTLNFKQKDLEYRGIRWADLSGKPLKRIEENPKACLNCHGMGQNRQALRPIIPQYPMWEGFFGSEDDVLFYGEKEYHQFVKFRKMAQKNRCFRALPWPQKKVPGYEHYPYHVLKRPDEYQHPWVQSKFLEDLKTRNYHLRTNLRFTDAFSHQLSRRVAGQFLKDPRFFKLNPLLMMEAFQCSGLDLDQELEKTLGKIYQRPTPSKNVNSMDPTSIDSRATRLYAVGSAFKMTPDEWTLHFNRPDDPAYSTGVHGVKGRDISISSMVQGLLLKQLSQELPLLQEQFHLSRGVSEFFRGQDFECIDDLGGSILFDSVSNQKKVCEILEKEYRSRKSASSDEASLSKGRTLESGSDLLDLSGIHQVLSDRYFGNGIKHDERQLRRKDQGMSVIARSCHSCHGDVSYLPQAYHFLSSPKTLKNALENDPSLLFRIFAYIDSGRMPTHQVLPNEDKLAIQEFLLDVSLK